MNPTSPDEQTPNPLSAAVSDAEHCLARRLRELRARAGPSDASELNAAVTALRRLIDAREALMKLERDEELSGNRQNPEDVAREVLDAIERLEAGGMRFIEDGSSSN